MIGLKSEKLDFFSADIEFTLLNSSFRFRQFEILHSICTFQSVEY